MEAALALALPKHRLWSMRRTSTYYGPGTNAKSSKVPVAMFTEVRTDCGLRRWALGAAASSGVGSEGLHLNAIDLFWDEALKRWSEDYSTMDDIFSELVPR